jgi:ubiquinone/menaquinone biosynthesis C-methylase UbiE
VKSTASTNEKWSIRKVIQEASKYNSVLDIGCGAGRLIKRIQAPVRVGIDACQQVIDEANKKNNGVVFGCLDLIHLDALYPENYIECVVGIDIIEHFEKEDAIKLLQECERIASKCLIFFVPVGNHPQTKDDRGFGNDHYQTHRSTWYPKDMKKLGYEVFHYPNWHKNIKPPKEKGAMFCLKNVE